MKTARVLYQGQTLSAVESDNQLLLANGQRVGFDAVTWLPPLAPTPRPRTILALVQASPMVVLGIPAGLTLQPWQLKKLVDEKKCDFYELWDGFAVFHFEQIAPGETRSLDLDLRADIAGAFEAPASQAFLYYSNDQRVWSKPERLEIGK